MTSEGELAGGRKDPHSIVGLGDGGAEQECRLAKVHPASETLHLFDGEVICVVHNSNGIAARWNAAKDVNDVKWVRLHIHLCAWRADEPGIGRRRRRRVPSRPA
jgi:hypothetical protein